MEPKRPPGLKNTEDSRDKRQSKRKPALRAADLFLDELRSPVACLVKDVSDTGLRLIYDSPHELPERVRIILLHPKKEIWCDIVWRHEKEVGLSIDLTE